MAATTTTTTKTKKTKNSPSTSDADVVTTTTDIDTPILLMIDNVDGLINILSYLDISDILPLMLLYSKQLEEPINNAIISSLLSTTSTLTSTKITTLNFSFLLKKFPNRLSSINKDKRAEFAICKLLSMMLPSNSTETSEAAETRRSIQRREIKIECCHLRSLTGQIWLNELLVRKFNNSSSAATVIVTLNLAGCTNINEVYLNDFLLSTTTASSQNNLRTLNLLNCHKVGGQTCNIISQHHKQLTSLTLGGCSQRTITDITIYNILINLRKLQYFDIQGLKHITGRISNISSPPPFLQPTFNMMGTNYFLDCIPSTIKSIQLCACESLGLGEEFQPRINLIEDYLNRCNQSTDLLLQLYQNEDDDEEEEEESSSSQQQQKRSQLKRIYLDGVDSQRRGILRGMIAYFALTSCGNLQEVSFSGCEQIQDWEIEILAKNCSQTLREFCCVGTMIGDSALKALGQHCSNQLIEVDISACVNITDRGIIDLCCSSPRRLLQHQHQYVPSGSTVSSSSNEGQQRDEGQPNNEDDHIGNMEDDNDGSVGNGDNANKRRKISSSSSVSSSLTWSYSSLRVLKIANNDELTNDAINSGISKLRNLHKLDVSECPNITTTALFYNITRYLPNLIDINAKGIADADTARGRNSLSSRLRNFVVPSSSNIIVTAKVPIGLRYVNQRSFVPPKQQQAASTSSSSCGCGESSSSSSSASICSVRKYSQRLTPSVPMNTMIHCIDCGLIPEVDRGVCQSCASTCHKGHNTFVGSWIRFYCDCPFSVLSTKTTTTTTTNGTNDNRKQKTEQKEQLPYCQAIFPTTAS